jgi:hypothetical protein
MACSLSWPRQPGRRQRAAAPGRSGPHHELDAITWLCSRNGSALAEPDPALIACGANRGLSSRAPYRFHVDHGGPQLVAVAARPFIVLNLSEFQQPGAFIVAVGAVEPGTDFMPEPGLRCLIWSPLSGLAGEEI